MSWMQFLFMLVIIAILCLVQTNRTAHYYVKLFIYHSIFMLTGAVALLPSLLRPRDAQNISIIRDIWNVLLRAFRVDVEKRGGKNLVPYEPSKSYIIVSNHQSSVDMIAMFQNMPDRTTALAKKELLFAGTFGIACWLCGVIFIDRLNREKAKSTLEATAQRILDKKLRIWVFPEGTRSMGDTLLPFKKGAFNLAVQAQIPVVPIVFSSYRQFLNPEKKIFKPGHIISQVLPPIPTKGLSHEDVPALTEKVQGLMNEEFQKLTKEVEERYGSTSESR